MSLQDTFLKLSRRDRQEAWQAARAKVAPGAMVRVEAMLEAHMSLKGMS